VFLCFILRCFSVKVELAVPLLCVGALPEKAVPRMTYTVSGGTLNPTHSVTHVFQCVIYCIVQDVQFSWWAWLISVGLHWHESVDNWRRRVVSRW